MVQDIEKYILATGVSKELMLHYIYRRPFKIIKVSDCLSSGPKQMVNLDVCLTSCSVLWMSF